MLSNVKVDNRLKKIEEYFKYERNAEQIMKIFEHELKEMYNLGYADGYAERHYDNSYDDDRRF